MPGTRQSSPAFAAAIWAASVLLVVFYGSQFGYRGARFATALAVFALLLAGQVFLAAGKLQESLPRHLGARGVLATPLLPLAAYLVYAAVAATLHAKTAAAAAAYALAPALILLPVRGTSSVKWQDYLAVLAIWLPVEMRWLYRLWPYPPELTHALTVLFALNTALAAFLLVRQLRGVGYRVEWGRGFGRIVLANFLVFAAIAVPLGMAIGFLAFDSSLTRLRSLHISVVGILLFTAWPEEFLFRGLLQNLLSRTLRSSTGGLVAASVVFGLAHINNGGFPNWRYALLATLAGIFYGRAWLKTGSILAATLVHALVDVTWHLLFR